VLAPWFGLPVARPGSSQKTVGKLFDLAFDVSKGEIFGTLVHAESAE
jgi:hypothetical protein